MDFVDHQKEEFGSASSADLMRIMETAGYVIVTVNERGVLLDISDSITTLTGYLPADLIGQHYTMLISPQWHEHVLRFYARQHRDAIPETTLECPILNHNGDECWIELSVIPNRRGGYHAVIHDITKRRQIEELHEENEARYRAMFDATFEVIILHDGETVVEVNPAFVEVFGCPRATAIGTLLSRYFSHFSEISYYLDRWHTQAVAQDGTIFDVEVRGKPITYQGRQLQVAALRTVASVRDHEKALDNHNELYRTLARHLPDTGVMLFDHDLRYMIVEGTILQALAFKKDETEGRTIYEVFSEDEITHLEPIYRSVLAGESTDYESVFQDKIYINQLFPVYDDSGEINAGMIVVRDITEARHAEQELRRNEQRFRSLFEQNNDAVFLIELNGEILDLNSRAVEMMGYDRETLSQKGSQLGIVKHHQIEKLLRGEELEMQEQVLRRKDGTRFTCEMSLTLAYEADGTISHIQAILRDITSRKQTEAKLAARVEQLKTLHQVDEELAERLSLEYVLSLALDFATRLSTAHAGFIGLLDEDNVLQIAKIIGDYPANLTESYAAGGMGIVGRVMRTLEAEVIPDVTKDPEYIETNPLTKAQMTIPLLSQERLIGVLNLESRRTDSFNYDLLGLLKLVTTRIAAAIDNANLYDQSANQLTQLKGLYAQVSHLEQMKTEMIRIASHDLRNPLSAIMGFLELMELDISLIGDPGDMQDHIRNMNRATRRMQKIIDDFLSLERLEESVDEQNDNYFDLVKLVENTYNESEPQAVLNSRQMNLETPAGSIIVRGQAPQLREAIANLINNAIKYTDVNGHVDVKLFFEGRKAVFEVADDGFGIQPEHQEKLFQPFYRVETKETEKIEGTGLGLHLVQRIVERHGGKMRFSSVYGEGSTFGFMLPYQSDDDL